MKKEFTDSQKQRRLAKKMWKKPKKWRGIQLPLTWIQSHLLPPVCSVSSKQRARSWYAVYKWTYWKVNIIFVEINNILCDHIFEALLQHQVLDVQHHLSKKIYWLRRKWIRSKHLFPNQGEWILKLAFPPFRLS